MNRTKLTALLALLVTAIVVESFIAIRWFWQAELNRWSLQQMRLWHATLDVATHGKRTSPSDIALSFNIHESCPPNAVPRVHTNRDDTLTVVWVGTGPLEATVSVTGFTTHSLRLISPKTHRIILTEERMTQHAGGG